MELRPRRHRVSLQISVRVYWLGLGFTDLGLGFTDLGIFVCCSLEPELWDVRIHLDGLDNIERSIPRDDITYMNLVALIEEKGFSIRDQIFCRKLEGDELVQNNAKIYELLDFFQSSKVLYLYVKRARASAAKH